MSADAETVRAALPKLHVDVAECKCSSCDRARSVRSVHAALDKILARAAEAEKALAYADEQIANVGNLAATLLGALRPWEMHPQEVRSAATRLTVSLAALPLPSSTLSGGGAVRTGERECPDCDGAGWYSSAEHDPSCDGNCTACPVQVQRQCEACGGSGYVAASVLSAGTDPP